MDPDSVHHRFSLRIQDTTGASLPLYFEPVFQIYGSGPLSLTGTGLPQAGGPGFALDIGGAGAGTPGLLLVSAAAIELPLGGGLVLYAAPPWALNWPVSFDSSGAAHLPFAPSASNPGGDLYAQAASLEATGAILHSNGLRITVLP